MRYILRLGNSCCPIPGKNIIVPDEPIIVPDEPIIDDNNYAWVEIGGLRWATMNIGAINETDTGLYFQWGDTQGYTAAQVGSGAGQKYFSWDDYKWTEDGGETFTKYNGSDYTVLQPSDDAVTAAWGGAWRTPTTAEYVALGNAVNTEWTDNYQGSGVAGMICTDNTDSSKVLFFPACGFCIEGRVDVVGIDGNYWSSSPDFQSALALDFYDVSVEWQSYYDRYYGFALRGVMDIV